MERRKKVILDRTLTVTLSAAMALQGVAPSVAWAAEQSGAEQAAVQESPERVEGQSTDARATDTVAVGGDVEEADAVTPQAADDSAQGADESTAGDAATTAEDQASQESIFAAGTGTAQDPYQISNLEQFKAFRDSVNAGTTYQGKYVKLTASIDLGNEEWEPIGANTTNFFKGTFDGGYSEGNPVVIKNLKVDGAGDHTGLFGYTWGANFKNICLEDVDVTGAKSTGALVSFAVGNIENCHVKGAIKIQGGNDSKEHFTAALAAQLYGNATDCTVEGDDGSTITALGKVGAIVGFLRENEGGVYTVKNCTVKNVAIKATGSWQGDAGAIVGGAYLSTVIESCTAEDVAVSGNAVGGIIGLVENAIVRNGVVTTKGCNIHDNVVKDSTVSGSNSGYILGVYRTGTFGYGALPGDYATTSENHVVSSSGAKCNGDAGRDGDTFDGKPFEYATVTFAKNDGTHDSFGSKTNFKGGTVAALGSQKRDGYVFKGWYKDAACTEEFDFTQALAGDTTVYAGWTEAVVSKKYSATATSATYYASVQDALNDAPKYSSYVFTLLKDTTESVTLAAGKQATLDLNGHTLTATDDWAIKSLGALTIKDSTATDPTLEEQGGKYVLTGYTGGVITGKSGIAAIDGGSVTVESGKVVGTSSFGVYVQGGFGDDEVKSSVTVKGGYIECQEFAASAQGRGAKLAISGGYFHANDNAVVAGNGTTTAGKYRGGTTMDITGGTFVGDIKSSGYIACGIYHPQAGTLNVSGGDFYVNGGVGVLVRAGVLNMTGGSVTTTGSASGKVGDSKIVADSYAVYVDGRSNYGGAKDGGLEANISGGTFKTAEDVDALALDKTTAAGMDGLGSIAVSNGENSAPAFSSKVPEEFCAEGFAPAKNEDGTYGVKVDASVAQVVDGDGNVVASYDSLQDAFAQAEAGQVVKLVKDVDCSTTGVTVNKSVTFDLNGHALKVAHGANNHFKITAGKFTLCDSSDTKRDGTGTGKIWTSDPWASAANAYGVIEVYSAQFTMESGLIDTASAYSKPGDVGQFGIVFAQGQQGGSVTIRGGHVKAGWYAVSGNGNSKTETTVNVEGGVLESVADYAIYQPQPGTVNMKGGVVYGEAGGIAMKRGALNMTGGTVTSKGTGNTGNWGDGTGNLGAAALNTSKRYGDVTVKISGGKLVAEQNDMIVDASGNYTATIAISGGTFSQPVDQAYCAEGFVPVTEPDENGEYTVKEDTSVAQVYDAEGNLVKSYDDLSNAIINAPANGTVKLLKDVDLGGNTISNNHAKGALTLDLQGHTITGSKGPDASGTEPVLFGVRQDLVIKNGAIANTLAGKNAVTVRVTDASLTLDNVTVKADMSGKAFTYGVKVVSSNANASLTVDGDSKIEAFMGGVTVIGNNKAGSEYRASLTLNSGTITGDAYGVAGNGSQDNTSITINGGKIESIDASDGCGIYHPQQGELTMAGGEVSGLVGIQMAGGHATITGGTVTSTDTAKRDAPYKKPSEGDGNVLDGAAVSVVSRKAYGDVSCEITGGTVRSGNAENPAIKKYGFEKGDDGYHVIEPPTEATLEVGLGEGAAPTFNTAVDPSYCKEGFAPAKNGDGSYTVTNQVASMVALGAGLRLDNHVDGTLSTTYEKCGIRFGYSFELPEGAELVGFTWTVSNGEQVREVKGANWAEVGGRKVCNLVLNGVRGASYAKSIEVSARVTYELADGTVATVPATAGGVAGGSLVRSVEGVARAVAADASESAEAKAFCEGLLAHFESIKSEE